MNLTRFSNKSPFDSIRRIDEKGIEVWYARELMTIMGYSKWDAFLTAIERAIENMGLAGDNVEVNASDYKEPSGKTNQERLNYRLSRYGAYMVALACDGRKQEVALAKKYFAVKTRQAEVVIPQQNDELEALKLKLALANAEKDRAIAEKNLLDTRNYIVTALPEPMQQKVLGYQVVEKKVVEKVVYKENEFIRNDSTVNKTRLCKRYGILSKGGSCDYKRLNKILATANLPSEAWLEVKDIQKNNELKVEYLNILDNLIIQDSRQLWIGE